MSYGACKELTPSWESMSYLYHNSCELQVFASLYFVKAQSFSLKLHIFINLYSKTLIWGLKAPWMGTPKPKDARKPQILSKLTKLWTYCVYKTSMWKNNSMVTWAQVDLWNIVLNRLMVAQGYDHWIRYAPRENARKIIQSDHEQDLQSMMNFT